VLDESAAFPWPGAADGGVGVRAHEFHYAGIEHLPAGTSFAYRVRRGHGADGEHDGIVTRNVLASFVHRRSTERDNWAARFVAFIRTSGYQARRRRSAAWTGSAREREALVG
jgi:cobyrinic acid a,c-diamide synthase